MQQKYCVQEYQWIDAHCSAILFKNYTQLYHLSYLIARINELSSAHQNRTAVTLKTQALTETIQPYR